MRFEHVNSYSAAPDAVYAMLTDASFREEVCAYIRSTDYAVAVADEDGRVQVRVEQTQIPRKLPAIAAKVVGDSVQIVQTEDWSAPGQADFAMEIPGKPGHLRGSIRLTPTSTGTDQVFTGEVKVQVPLVGGKLEGLVADLLRKALAAEGRVGEKWLSGESQA